MAAKGPRRLANDDLLRGFDETGPSGGQLKAFFATTVVVSLYAWDVAFTYGAFHTFFYQNTQRLLVVSMVVLFGTLLVRAGCRYGHGCWPSSRRQSC